MDVSCAKSFEGIPVSILDTTNIVRMNMPNIWSLHRNKCIWGR